jgi:hypothetical protein
LRRGKKTSTVHGRSGGVATIVLHGEAAEGRSQTPNNASSSQPASRHRFPWWAVIPRITCSSAVPRAPPHKRVGSRENCGLSRRLGPPRSVIDQGGGQQLSTTWVASVVGTACGSRAHPAGSDGPRCCVSSNDEGQSELVGLSRGRNLTPAPWPTREHPPRQVSRLEARLTCRLSSGSRRFFSGAAVSRAIRSGKKPTYTWLPGPATAHPLAAASSADEDA